MTHTPRAGGPKIFSVLLAVLVSLVLVAGLDSAALADPSPAADPSASPTESPSSGPSPSAPPASASSDPDPTPSPTAGLTTGTTSTPEASPSPSAVATTPAPEPSASATATADPAARTPAGWKTPEAPDDFDPIAGTLFNHPFDSTRHAIVKRRFIRTVNSVPRGGIIKIASWSFASYDYVQALVWAKKRGVTVQVILSARNEAGISDYPKLAQYLGTNKNAATINSGSFVYRCTYSCRGAGGTMHSKIFLFSTSHNTPFVAMMGSANLTEFAMDNQWNQTFTTLNRDVYLSARNIFAQMKADRAPARQYVVDYTRNIQTTYFPQPGASASTDPMMRALNAVHCTGAVASGRNGRTVIKIAMYAWFEDRGLWLARRVRQLWNQGCYVQVQYAIMGNTVKQVLYSPTGRGRIPMRSVIIGDPQNNPDAYMHTKFVAISGHVSTNTHAWYVWQGSFNFANLGFRSDEQVQRLSGRGIWTTYSADFTKIWTEPTAKAPSPSSRIAADARYAPGGVPVLGEGPYRNMSND